MFFAAPLVRPLLVGIPATIGALYARIAKIADLEVSQKGGLASRLERRIDVVPARLTLKFTLRADIIRPTCREHE